MDKSTEETIKRLYFTGKEISHCTAVFQAYSSPSDVLIFSRTNREAHRDLMIVVNEIGDLATNVIYAQNKIVFPSGGSISFLPIGIREDRLRGLSGFYFSLNF